MLEIMSHTRQTKNLDVARVAKSLSIMCTDVTRGLANGNKAQKTKCGVALTFFTAEKPTDLSVHFG